jgi:hypothetical protein
MWSSKTNAVLSPHIDHLSDRGYITFTNDADPA